MSETADHRRLTELRSLLGAIEEAGWEYARVEIDGVALVVCSDAGFVAGDAPPARPVDSPPAPDAAARPAPDVTANPVAPAAPSMPVSDETAAAALPDGPVETVVSPTIGLFWRSPKPGAPPFVDIGTVVAEGDTVCIVEVMKLMTHVTAPTAGTVTAIHTENGSMVEHGTPLVDIVPTTGEESSR